ncbi:MAG: sulfatase [Candidatus Omnitrophota bacterium]
MRKKTAFFVIIVFLFLGCTVVFLAILFSHSRWSLNRPNILLVTVCSLRQDRLGCYGYSRNTSPNIDNFAKTATIFKNSYTHIPWTKPAIIALMSGKYPASSFEIEEKSALPELLRSAGYLTYGIVGTNVAREFAKADRGFNIYLDNLDLRTSKDYYTVQADTIADQAIRVLSNTPARQPVFLWLFFKDPHWPYLPPLTYREKFVNDLLYVEQSQKLRINADRNNSIGGIGEARLRDKGGDFITDKAYYIAQYDSEILYMDSQFGRVVEYLKQKSKYEDWVVIFLSDHGENMTEDNYFFDHGYKLTEGLVRIPLIVKFPKQKRVNVVKSLVSICDVYPTILSLAGICKDGQKDKLCAVRLSKNTMLQRFFNSNRVIMLENNPDHEIENTKLVGLVWRFYKLIYDLTTNEKILYDVSDDEIQIKEPGSGHKVVIDKMSKFIVGFSGKADKEYSSGREELKSLGYLQ